MYVSHLSKSSNCRKLTQFWTGRFPVVDKTSPVNCRLRNIQTDKDLPVLVHVYRLKPAYDRFCRPTQPPTDPEQRTDIAELSHNDLNMEDVESLSARRPNNDSVPTSTLQDVTTDTPDLPTTGKTDDEFINDDILDTRVRRNRREYEVKWKGYDARSNSWIAENLMNQVGKEYAQSIDFKNK
jgi:hypothetical protein